MGDESSKAMLRITGVIAQYWVVSISLVYINKFILSEQSAPIFITWSQVSVRRGLGRLLLSCSLDMSSKFT